MAHPNENSIFISDHPWVVLAKILIILVPDTPMGARIRWPLSLFLLFLALLVCCVGVLRLFK